jgi:hypothetical protein
MFGCITARIVTQLDCEKLCYLFTRRDAHFPTKKYQKKLTKASKYPTELVDVWLLPGGSRDLDCVPRPEGVDLESLLHEHRVRLHRTVHVGGADHGERQIRVVGRGHFGLVFLGEVVFIGFRFSRSLNTFLGEFKREGRCFAMLVWEIVDEIFVCNSEWPGSGEIKLQYNLEISQTNRFATKILLALFSKINYVVFVLQNVKKSKNPFRNRKFSVCVSN